MATFTRTIEDSIGPSNTLTTAATTNGVAVQHFPPRQRAHINSLMAQSQWLYVNATSNRVGQTPLAMRKEIPVNGN